ncbi:MAG: helix-turn-helix domain-containing protein [Eggerthellaceae bacterium]|nr:helix-turn-helix domain-containing protein [Eggerthellaceae bacterium]
MMVLLIIGKVALMKLDGNAALYQLQREFKNVSFRLAPGSMMLDYPLLYDEAIDMSGHVVLLSDSDRPRASEHMQQVMCVCLSDEVAWAARERGFFVAQVHDDVSFQHLYNRLQSVFLANERFETQLHAYVDTYAGYKPILDACLETMGFACVLIDGRYRTVCQSGDLNLVEDSGKSSGGQDAWDDDGFGPTVLDEDVVDLFMASQHYRRMRTGRKVFSMPGANRLFMRNVFFEDKPVGMLVMKHQGDVMSASYVRFLLNYLAPFVEGMYARIGSFDLTAVRPTGIRTMLKGVLEGAVDNAPLLSLLLLEEGNDQDDCYMLLRLERSFTNEGAEGLAYFAQRLERALPQAYCAETEGKLYALVHVGAPLSEEGFTSRSVQDFLAKLPAVLRDKLVKAGASRPFSDMRKLLAARLQADAALERGDELDPAYWYYRFNDYALGWLLHNGCSSIAPEYVCHSAVVQLKQYDEHHGTSLLDTLAVFMSCRYNATLAAQKLFVARSTLLNRLERITELTSVNLDSLEERTYLGVSLVLLGYLG